MRSFGGIYVLLSFLVSCSGGSNGARDESGSISQGAEAHEPARLVIAIIYDQFPSWVYSRYRPLLSPDGALRRTRARGADHIVELSYSGTSTAPGHAAIATGMPPAQSGVGSNQAWSTTRGSRSIVDDGEHRVFGVEDAFASPTILEVDTVADQLRETYGDQTRIVGLSYKDRGAILNAGRDPDLALWYDKRIGSITTSSYYDEALPDWVSRWSSENPIEDYFEDWHPANPDELERLLGPDLSPGEGDYRGFGITFPHNPRHSEDPRRTFRLMPQSTDHLLSLARASIAELGMGDDEVPDLLVLSISSTDYVGHTFGPESWEYVDHLIRIDAAVGAFLAELEAKIPLSVLITSDHGVARLPERARVHLPTAGRIYPDTLPTQLNTAVSKVLGEGLWVGSYDHPFVYLNEFAQAEGKRGEAIEAVIEALERLPEVHRAYDVAEAIEAPASSSPLDRMVALSIPRSVHGDVLVVPERGSVVDEGMPRGAGTSHGTPWLFDRQVPVVFSGPGIERTWSTDPMDQARVAATLSRLLGIEPPSQIAQVAPLPGS